MQVINFENIVDIPIAEVENNTTGGTGGGNGVPGVDSEKINASTSIYNYPDDIGGSIAGWSTNVTWQATDYNTISWGNGYVYLPDGTALSITSGNTGNMSATTYIYYDMDTNTIGKTTTASDSVGKKKILLCVAKPNSVSTKYAEFQAFGTDAQSTFITADNIAANTITANEIASNTITANEMSVSQLSAISADLGTVTAGTIQGCTVRAFYGSGASLDEIKIWTDGTLPKIQFTDNGTVVGTINGATVNGMDAIAIGGSGKYVGLVGSTICSGKLKIPVGTNLYD